MNYLYTVFKTKKSCYLYDAVTNRIFTISPVLYTYHKIIFKALGDEKVLVPLKTHHDYGKIVRTLGEVRDALDSGLIRPNKIKHVIFDFEYEEYINNLAHSMRYMMLEITERCNLRCSYCCYSGHYRFKRIHGTISMPLITAMEAVKFFHSHSSDSPVVRIGFFGGEPLLEFETITKIVEYAETLFRSTDKTRSYEMISNGTLLTENVLDWFASLQSRNSRISTRIIITLNGPGNIHDRHRVTENGRGTHQVILNNLTLFAGKYPKIFRENLVIQANYLSHGEIPCIIDFFNSQPLFKGIPVLLNQATLANCDAHIRNLAAMPGSGSRSKARIFKALRDKLMVELKSEQEGRTILKSFIGDRLFQIHQRKMAELGENICFNGVCKPLLSRFFVKTDGTLHICERMDEMRGLGSVLSGIDVKETKRLLTFFSTTLEKNCRSCFAVRLCSICFEHLLNSNGYDRVKHAFSCNNSRKRLLEDLRAYCESRELHGDIFRDPGKQAEETA